MNRKLCIRIFQVLKLPSPLLLPSMDEGALEELPSCSHRDGLYLKKMSWFLVVVLLRWSRIALVSSMLSLFISTQRIARDVEALLRAWRFLEKKTDYVFLAGDFNCVDKHAPQLWDVSV